MIRPSDFEIENGRNDRGTVVRVSQKRTGSTRIAENVLQGQVGEVRDRLTRQLKEEIVSDQDVRISLGSSDAGDFIDILHIPSEIRRTALRCECSDEKLLARVLDAAYDRSE